VIVSGPAQNGDGEQQAGGYEYDLFISYRRRGTVCEWVKNHFVRVLDLCLVDHVRQEPRIFLDIAQDVGTHWPQNLKGDRPRYE
jgi:hypothetical protein